MISTKFNSNKFNFCIVGSGPAGITLALELSKIGTVCLLESGARDVGNIDNFVAIEEGFPSYLTANRLSKFGGTSGHWAGWCSPLDRSDFLKRDLNGELAWAGITLDQLEPFYKGAAELLGIEGENLSFKEENLDMIDNFCFKKFNYSTPPLRFGEFFWNKIVQSKSIYLYLNSSAHSIEIRDSNEGQLVSKIKVKQNKNFFDIEADHFILAAGGIDSTRLMLNWQETEYIKTGKKINLNIGYNFIDHPHFYNAGKLVSTLNIDKYRANKLREGFVSEIDIEDQTSFFYQVAASVRTKKSMNNLVIRLIKEEPTDDVEKGFLKLYQDLSGYKNAGLFRIIIMAEQICGSSKLRLSDSKDHNGLKRIILSWVLEDKDWQSYIQSMNLFGDMIAQRRFGYLKFNEEFMNRKSIPNPGPHHMGSLRIGINEKVGVVDKNLNVFGFKNLKILSSAVFPTGGCANPTLTILAFAYRLADYFKDQASKMN